MCDLFGMSCNDVDRATNSLPRFARHAEKNSHGWGIGWYENGAARVVRAPEQGDRDPRYWETMEEARSEVIIGHVRWATGTAHCECNCHPFIRHHRGRDWMLAHNGWSNDYRIHPGAEGDTDSEQIFQEIMDSVSEYQESGGIKGIYPALKKAIVGVFERHGRDVRLNLLISDGRTLYAFQHYPNKPIYILRRSKSYGGAILMSTQKLTEEDWEPIPENRLLAVEGGEVQVMSTAL
jgi:predicted glutamine amidotransferase